MTHDVNDSTDQPESIERRKFLSKTGRFAIATPPAITLLLSTSLEAEAKNKIRLSDGGKDKWKKDKWNAKKDKWNARKDKWDDKKEARVDKVLNWLRKLFS